MEALNRKQQQELEEQQLLSQDKGFEGSVTVSKDATVKMKKLNQQNNVQHLKADKMQAANIGHTYHDYSEEPAIVVKEEDSRQNLREQLLQFKKDKMQKELDEFNQKATKNNLFEELKKQTNDRSAFESDDDQPLVDSDREDDEAEEILGFRSKNKKY